MIRKENRDQMRFTFLTEVVKNDFDNYLSEAIANLNEGRISQHTIIKEGGNEQEKLTVLNLIKNNSFELNNYDAFINSLKQSNRGGFLTQYTPQELKNRGVKTFKLKGYNIGYGITQQNDIVGLHNNSDIGGIGETLMRSAISNGGETLDHFDGYLSDFYQNLGFQETDRVKWDDQYKPKDWDSEKYGTPDVIYRKYKQE